MSKHIKYLRTKIEKGNKKHLIRTRRGISFVLKE